MTWILWTLDNTPSTHLWLVMSAAVFTYIFYNSVLVQGIHFNQTLLFFMYSSILSDIISTFSHHFIWSSALLACSCLTRVITNWDITGGTLAPLRSACMSVCEMVFLFSALVLHALSCPHVSTRPHTYGRVSTFWIRLDMRRPANLCHECRPNCKHRGEVPTDSCRLLHCEGAPGCGHLW